MSWPCRCGGAWQGNAKFFRVRLQPGCGVTLDMGVKRYANKQTYAFPWHGDSVPGR